MSGRVAVPIAIQQGIDRGIRAPGGPDLSVVAVVVLLTLAALAVSTTCGYLMTRRLFTVSETALGALRSRTFRHIHDLSMLHQQSERRGSLVSRVTGDVDQITQFLQTGGVMLLLTSGQLVVTTIVMFVYSWQLTLVVFAAFLPAAVVIRLFQRRLAAVYRTVRERTGTMLGAVGESVVGATVIRAYGVADRTERRLDTSIDRLRVSQQRALRTSVISFSTGELAAGVALAAVVVVGVLLGVDGGLTVGKLTAFLFLVTLFIQPVQIATEVLNEAQNAVAGWRRVLDVLDIEPDVADPDDAGVPLPPGPLSVRFRDVAYRYPGRPDRAVRRGPGDRGAHQGRRGGRDRQRQDHLRQAAHPADGPGRRRGAAVRHAADRGAVRVAAAAGGDGAAGRVPVRRDRGGERPLRPARSSPTTTWIWRSPSWAWPTGSAGCRTGCDTQVGERGEALSVGERQLVALVRAYVADPDLLVLDEATSAVDPATEVRLQRALDAVTRGRTTVAIAHRLSTAQSADEVIVVDAGRVVQRGPHARWSRRPTRSTPSSTRPGWNRPAELPRVELDDQLLVADDRDLGAQRLADHRGAQVLQDRRQVRRGRARPGARRPRRSGTAASAGCARVPRRPGPA